MSHLSDENGVPYTYKTDEKFVAVDCEACGESFYSRKEFIEWDGSTLDIGKEVATLPCRYCKRKCKLNIDYAMLPLKHDNFEKFLDQQSEVVQHLIKERSALIEATLVECIERLLGRLPTDEEITANGKAILREDTGITEFYYGEVLLFLIEPPRPVGTNMIGMRVKKFV